MRSFRVGRSPDARYADRRISRTARSGVAHGEVAHLCPSPRYPSSATSCLARRCPAARPRACPSGHRTSYHRTAARVGVTATEVRHHERFVSPEVAISQPIHQAVAQRVQPLLRMRLHDTGAGAWSARARLLEGAVLTLTGPVKVDAPGLVQSAFEPPEIQPVAAEIHHVVGEPAAGAATPSTSDGTEAALARDIEADRPRWRTHDHFFTLVRTDLWTRGRCCL